MSNHNVEKKKRAWIFIAALISVVTVAAIFLAIISYRMSQVPLMTFDEMLAYTTKDNEKAIITVGIIKDGEMDFTVYGNNASILPNAEYVYEIGSLTKTFTVSLLSKAIYEGKANLDDPISTFIALPEKAYAPTLKKLVTHTSGYKGYYFDWQMARNFFTGQQNDFYGIDDNSLENQMGNIEIKDGDYEFQYSNFGFAALGRVLESIYGQDYTQLMNDFIADDLGLEHTKISDGTGDLDGYWNWKPNDAYMSAGAITSTITDMMKYIQMQMTNEEPYFSQMHEISAQIDANPSQYEKMNIRMDAAGIGWMIDSKNNLIWHNGGTSNFNSYAAFDKDKQLGVVILSNCSPDFRLPATVMGARLMLDLQNEVEAKQ